MKTRTHILIVLFSVPLLIPTSFIYAQEDGKEKSPEQSSEWKLQKSYEELKEITQKEHDPELDVKELNALRKPGVYKGNETVTITKSGESEEQIKQNKLKVTQQIKYVDGKYLVNRMTSKKTTQWIITTYNEKCKCYRSWILMDGKILFLGIGNRVNKTNIVSWSLYIMDHDRKHIVNGYEKISENQRTIQLRNTMILEGQRIVRLTGKYTFHKPLSEAKKEDLRKEGTKSY